MAMQCVPPLARVGSAFALVLVLAACTPGGQFDPTEVINIDTKKKIPGDREPLFPNGVPGAETGVPPDLVKGYKPPPDQAAESADAAAAPAVVGPVRTAVVAPLEKPKPKLRPKPKARPKSKVARAPAQTNWPAPAPGASTARTNWPAPPSTAAGAQTNWPAPPSTAPAQQAAQPAQSIWPNPPAPGANSH